MELEYVLPGDIERRSFEIIAGELQDRGIELPGDSRLVIMRAIHTTADFDYASTLTFSDNAVEVLKGLIHIGATIVTDTNMGLSGINKRELARHGCAIECYMADEEVASEARRRSLTRASVSMEKAMRLDGPVIFVVGNAPTALVTIREAQDKGIYRPAFVVGVPVGFVNVEAAKELILETDIPHIINRGRKGGSNVAASIINAVLYMLRDEEE